MQELQVRDIDPQDYIDRTSDVCSGLLTQYALIENVNLTSKLDVLRITGATAFIDTFNENRYVLDIETTEDCLDVEDLIPQPHGVVVDVGIIKLTYVIEGNDLEEMIVDFTTKLGSVLDGLVLKLGKDSGLAPEALAIASGFVGARKIINNACDTTFNKLRVEIGDEKFDALGHIKVSAEISLNEDRDKLESFILKVGVDPKVFDKDKLTIQPYTGCGEHPDIPLHYKLDLSQSDEEILKQTTDILENVIVALR